jgi:beta-glucosidase
MRRRWALVATHAAPGAGFLPDKASALFGELGVGGIHDLYPNPQQANEIQRWLIAHSRLGIPALFIEEGLPGYDTGTVFPVPIGLAATWDPAIAQGTAESIAAEARANGVDLILAPVLDLARDPRWGRLEEDFGEAGHGAPGLCDRERSNRSTIRLRSGQALRG